mmetsp:Transcript_84520/g.167802  ORF Transcript_84520/g.167802 Transcript_84520/m.167802 type:complete len:319 (-) Transcript_84520:509-1465(-)
MLWWNNRCLPWWLHGRWSGRQATKKLDWLVCINFTLGHDFQVVIFLQELDRIANKLGDLDVVGDALTLQMLCRGFTCGFRSRCDIQRCLLRLSMLMQRAVQLPNIRVRHCVVVDELRDGDTADGLTDSIFLLWFICRLICHCSYAINRRKHRWWCNRPFAFTKMLQIFLVSTPISSSTSMALPWNVKFQILVFSFKIPSTATAGFISFKFQSGFLHITCSSKCKVGICILGVEATSPTARGRFVKFEPSVLVQVSCAPFWARIIVQPMLHTAIHGFIELQAAVYWMAVGGFIELQTAIGSIRRVPVEGARLCEVQLHR